eukprot:TRINITY_DN49450_c0_g1_i3.p1 TRINITY_DN49450_c0_g1~~TRINITY_DN49450_c0_g1_i3.p1  ORF type:complete len:394 (-),score=88.88 TRINITY_DN49450_c0_g1_i3:203-1384(-)
MCCMLMNEQFEDEINTLGVTNSRVRQLQEINRRNRSSSEWALLDTLEVVMYNNECDQQRQNLISSRENTRNVLSKQMEFLNQRKRAEEEQKVRDKQRIDSAVEKYENECKEIEKQNRIKNTKMKKERWQQIQEFRDKREADVRRRILEDKQQLKAIQFALEDERKQKEQKALEDNQQLLETLKDNQQRLQAKYFAKLQEKEEDQQLMEEYLRTLEKQEKARQDALGAFQKSVAQRSEKVGRIAIAEAAQRAETEELLLKTFEEQQEKKIRLEAERKKAAHDKFMEQIDRDRKNQMAIRGKLKEEEKREKEVIAAQLKAQAEQQVSEDQEALDRRRRRNIEHQKAILAQIKEREERDVLDDTYMTRQERKLNAQLIHQAKTLVGGPKAIRRTHK